MFIFALTYRLSVSSTNISNANQDFKGESGGECEMLSKMFKYFTRLKRGKTLLMNEVSSKTIDGS